MADADADAKDGAVALAHAAMTDEVQALVREITVDPAAAARTMVLAIESHIGEALWWGLALGKADAVRRARAAGVDLSRADFMDHVEHGCPR